MILPENLRLVDVANETGVSIATISRYLNRKNIRPELKRKLEDFFSRKGFLDIIKKDETSSNLIGLLIPDCFNRTFSLITDGIMTEARKSNYAVIPVYAQGDPSIEEYHLEAFKKMDIKGLIYFPISSDEILLQKRIAAFKDIPIVIAWRRLTGHNLSHVYVDNIESCYNATKYLLNLGRRNIALLTSGWEPLDKEILIKHLNDTDHFSGIGIDRIRGYKKALDEYGIEFSSRLIMTTIPSYEEAIISSARLIQNAYPFDGIIVASDIIGAACCQVFKSHGYRIPQDISIICCGDGVIALINQPTLTCIKEQPFEVGRSSMELLNEQINGLPKREISFSTEIIPRGSTSIKI